MPLLLRGLLVLSLLIVAHLNYSGILYGMYSYTGLIRPGLGLDDFAILFSWAVLAVAFIPDKIRQPSDFFLLFYNLICFMWGAIFWSITGLISYGLLPVFLVIVVTPNIVFLLLRGKIADLLGRYVPPIQFASWRMNVLPLSIVAFAGAYLASQAVGSGSFDFNDVYARRLDARDILAANPLANYAMNMATNGAVPILAFIACYRRSYIPAIIALTYVVLIYWLVGQKSPILNVALMMVIGTALRERRIGDNFVSLLLLMGVGGYGISLVANSLMHNSLIADVIIRRISVTQPQIQTYYFDLWAKSPLSEMLFGLKIAGYTDYTFMIGDLYLKNPADNANVNAFMYALVSGGLFGYLVAIIAITLVFSLFDSFYEKTRRVEFFGLAAIFAILLSEQAYTTSLLSSGIALCLVLVMLFSYP